MIYGGSSEPLADGQSFPKSPRVGERTNNMKEKRFFPEKGLLMFSGAAFLLLIVPAWVPGFVWCGVAAVLLCAAVWRLPVSRQRVRALLSNPVHMALSLAFNGALAVNFYHNWVDSQKMQRVAGVLGMENGLFVPLCAAFFAIAAAPAAGCVISYYISAGQEDYRRTKAETLRSGETGIPMGKALLILFAVFVVGISAILRANFYYMDDSPRAALGYKQWDYFSRYLSTALATLVHGGDYLADAAPLPQVLAMLIMAVSGILMGYIVYERTTFSGWELAVLSILGLNPYFLGCVSFRFDAPYMALSVLAAVVPLLYRNRNTAAYVLASGLGILAVCTSYQAAAGIFPMLVVALALRMWNRGESIREVGLFCLKSAAGYALGLIFFKLIIMIPADTSYVGNALPPAGELIPHFLKNLRSYYSLVLSDFKPFWLIAAVLAVIAFCVRVVLDSRRKTVPDIATLAGANPDDVLRHWQGLGYYSRARNLQTAARDILRRYGGVMPSTRAEIRTLKGIGDYTAGAILSLAFGLREPAIDGNVLRVFARLYLIEENILSTPVRRHVTGLVQSQLPADRPGDFNEALMDLGATLCVPRAPRCGDCPLAGLCLAHRAGREQELPLRVVRKHVPVEHVAALWLKDGEDRLLVHRRPDSGLLAGMMELLSCGVTETADRAAAQATAESAAGVRRKAARLLPSAPVVEDQPCAAIRHVFSSRVWDIRVYAARVTGTGHPDRSFPASDETWRWLAPGETGDILWAGPYGTLYKELCRK